jgi:GTP cyclohydrolase I
VSRDLATLLGQLYPAPDGAVDALGVQQNFEAFLEEFRQVAGPAPLRTFRAPSRDPVVFRALPFHSLCAHHLLPFFGEAEIAYEPVDRIAGLGAVPRALRELSRQLTLQEALTARLADFLHAELGGPVAVRLRARQMCMEMRGAESAGTIETFALRGGATVALLSG